MTDSTKKTFLPLSHNTQLTSFVGVMASVKYIPATAFSSFWSHCSFGIFDRTRDGVLGSNSFQITERSSALKIISLIREIKLAKWLSSKGKLNWLNNWSRSKLTSVRKLACTRRCCSCFEAILDVLATALNCSEFRSLTMPVRELDSSIISFLASWWAV